MQNQTLNEALVNFPLDSLGGSYSFLDRLCRENNWSRPFARRAIGEYKRFLYLSQVSPTPVTPPYVVDQVWHLHLLYTRSYWDQLCQPILGRPLHHGPTAGGAEEDEKFTNWYAETRALYLQEFAAPPPSDIWPARFSPEKPVRWVDLSRNWVIRKPSAAPLFGVFPLILLGPIPLPVLLLTLAGLVLFVIWKLLIDSDGPDDPKKRKHGDSDGCGAFSGCSSDSSCGDSSSGGDCGGGDGGGGCGGGGCGGGCGGGD